jgi:hypothetical protein
MNPDVAANPTAIASGGSAMRGSDGWEDWWEWTRASGLVVLLALLLMFGVGFAHAGGPRWVSGSSYFNSSEEGQPVVWSGGQVSYFTDLGDLSAEVSQAQANAMVAAAAGVWNGVNTAALSIEWGGSLAEDVNGSNVIAGTNGVTMPADIEPTAANRRWRWFTTKTARRSTRWMVPAPARRWLVRITASW